MKTPSTSNIRTIWPVNAYNEAVFLKIQSAHDAGHDVDDLLIADPWVLEQSVSSTEAKHTA